MNYACTCCHKLFRKFVGTAMKANFFKIAMRSVVTVLNLFPAYVASYELIEYMPEMDRFIWKFALLSMILMSLLSYWTATLRKLPKIPVSLSELTIFRNHPMTRTSLCVASARPGSRS